MMAEDQSTRTGGDSTYRSTSDDPEPLSLPPPSFVDPYMPPDDPHAVLSPANGFESFFISPELRSPNVSATFVASKLRSVIARGGSSSVRSGASTIATDDFASACEDAEDMPPEPDKSLFGKDILILTRNPVIPEDEFDSDAEDEEDEEQSMSKVVKKVVKKNGGTTTTTTAAPVEEHEGANASQVVYEKVKDVWTWGKTVPFVSFFEGIAETAATKVATMAGMSMEEIDASIKPHLKGLDSTYLNPAIETLLALVSTGVAKADGTLRPIVEALIKQLPMIKSEKKESSPTSTSPELTTAPVAVN